VSKIKIGTLKNGMVVYAQSDYSRSSHLWSIGVRAGSLHDPPGKIGLAHHTEHVICAQSNMYTSEEMDLLCERLTGGPEGNIYIATGRESTCYGPADFLPMRRKMEKLFGAFAGMLRDQIITPESFAAEAAAIHNEFYLRGYHDMDSTIYDMVHRHLYTTNPARNSVLGSVNDVRRITIKDTINFAKTYYVPSNMFLVLLGPRFKEAMNIAQKYFGDWNPPTIPMVPWIRFKDSIYQDDIFPGGLGKSSVHLGRRGVKQHYVAVAFRTEPSDTKDGAAIEVLGRLLAHRMKRRLRDANTDFEKGVYRFLHYTERTFMHGVIYFYFASVSGDFATYGEQVIQEECEKVKQKLVPAKEMSAFVESLQDQYKSMMTRCPAELLEGILTSASNGDDELIGLYDYGDSLKKLTRQKLRAVANKYFTENYLTVRICPLN